MYHYVRSLKNSAYPEIKGLEETKFKNQLEYFKKKFEFGNFIDIIDSAYIKNEVKKNEVKKNEVILTFDDGLKDHYTTVYPILKKMGIKGYFFPPSKPIEEKMVLDVHKIHFILASTQNKNQIIKEIFRFINKNKNSIGNKTPQEYFKELSIPNRFDTKEVIFIKRILQRELPLELRNEITTNLFKKFVTKDESKFSEKLYMSLEEMKEMSESGMIFGSHSHSHEWLSHIDNKKLINEVENSKKFCHKISSKNNEIIMCYPYGDYNEQVINEISKRGFKAGLTTNVGDAEIIKEKIFELSRYDTNDFPQ